MAHEIRENDKLFSVIERPWHGLGTIIENAPTIEEAITLSGLDWNAELSDMTVNVNVIHGTDDAFYMPITVPDQKAIIRTDINKVLGVVGNRYKIYQNSEMWEFIDGFQKESGIKLETAGSLKNGRTTWVLAKKGTFESVTDDPIEEYFLFTNSFDGTSPIRVMFTNIRVVCNNTLTASIRNANNIFNVRHTNSAEGQIKEVKNALGIRTVYQNAMKVSLDMMAKKQLSSTKIINFLENTIFPLKVSQTVGKGDTVQSFEESKSNGSTIRENNLDLVCRLMDEGAGSNIKGVRGTAYGVYNALTEYADHHKRIRNVGDRDERELRFENAFMTSASKFKEDVHKKIMSELIAA